MTTSEPALHFGQLGVNGQDHDRLLLALGAASRDEALLQLGVPACRIGSDFYEELWFDLRAVRFDRADQKGLERAHLENLVLDLSQWSELDLHTVSFRQAQLRGATFDRCVLGDVSFEGATMDHATFRHSELPNVQMNGAIIGPLTLFENCNLKGAHFTSTLTRGPLPQGEHPFSASFVHCNVEGARFGSARIPGAVFRELSLVGVNLSNATLEQARFDTVELGKVDFSDAVLDGARFLNARANETALLRNTSFRHVQVGELFSGSPDIRFLDWGHEFVLGEEDRAGEAPSRLTRALWLRTAEVNYRWLSQRYREQGFFGEARRFEFRAIEAQRRQLWNRVLAGEGSFPEMLELGWLAISAAFGHGCQPRSWLIAFLAAWPLLALLRWRFDRCPLGTAFRRALFGLVMPAGRVLDLRPLTKLLARNHQEHVSSVAILNLAELGAGLLFLTFAVRTAVNLHP